MAIDFSQSPEQKAGGAGPIPSKSCVKVKMTIRNPKAEKATPDHPLVTIFSSGLVGLDCEFEVMAGQFEGTRIWENMFFRPEFQNIQMSKGQTGICNSSDAKFRAIIEASRGIDPHDGSTPAIQARSIQDWGDFSGMEFPIQVGVAKPQKDDKFVNNNIFKILTPDRDEYQEIMAGGEIISDIPLPELHPGGTSTTKPGTGGGGYTPPGQSGGYTPPNQQGAQGGGGYTPPSQTTQGDPGQAGGGAQAPTWAQ